MQSIQNCTAYNEGPKKNSNRNIFVWIRMNDSLMLSTHQCFWRNGRKLFPINPNSPLNSTAQVLCTSISSILYLLLIFFTSTRHLLCWTMQLIAETAAGDRVPLEADPDETINVLKAQIHEKTGVKHGKTQDSVLKAHIFAVTCTTVPINGPNWAFRLNQLIKSPES